ncbi:MAG: YqgE/AlgH family protein [Proteobacteria bacterium]|nr:YqgE/AlgH family protein [Pseudomonadota bacterium]
MARKDEDTGYLTGQLLIAMPQLQDTRFERSVIYLCVHNEDGAMGLVVNCLSEDLTFPELLEQVGVELKPETVSMPIHIGGPVETGMGFVLHTNDYEQANTIKVNDFISLTHTVEILKDIADGQGPRQAMLALGYAGWDAGQLDGEIQENSWLNVPADEALIFEGSQQDKWQRSIAKLGVDVSLLSGEAGHA